MIREFFSEQELQKAAASVRSTMLDALPQEAEGEFSEAFELKIKKLKQAKRKRDERLKRLTAAAASFAVIVTMFFALNTEVRAAVVSWFTETFDTHMSFWFRGEEPDVLPTFVLSDVPEKYVCVYDETLENSRTMLYLNPEDESDGFTFSYGFIQDDAPLTVDYNGTDVAISEVLIHGCPGKLYMSVDADESHALIWIDESNEVVFSITSFLEPEAMLHIAEGVKLVK